MVLIDSSAWIEFLRGTGSAAHDHVVAVLRADDGVTTEPVMMEVFAGARDDTHEQELRALLGRTRLVPCTQADYQHAAQLFRSCRRGGAPVRRLIDCLIAAVAIREEQVLLHGDRDFEKIARHSTLQLMT